jgi:hypothetical protein
VEGRALRHGRDVCGVVQGRALRARRAAQRRRRATRRRRREKRMRIAALKKGRVMMEARRTRHV